MIRPNKEFTMDNDIIQKKEALRQIRLALHRTALLYHHFAETLVAELGEKKGTELIRKAIEAYGARIGGEARSKARDKGLSPTPENFESDLPDLAWERSAITVDGEKRTRVTRCPLAEEWLAWGDPQKARLYCYVDQAKMRAFNPDYEYVHFKTLLDGDPCCELAVRRSKREGPAEVLSGAEPNTLETVWWLGGRYTREDLMKMEPACLRALFRERVHHAIEVLLYPILLGKKNAPKNYGHEPELILDVWRKRGLSEEGDDFDWGKKYLAIAKRIREKKGVAVKERAIVPFTRKEMEAVRKLIWDRRSIRDWIPGKEIPDALITQILEAGRAAPTGCNMDVARFIVIRDPKEMKTVWSDIPTPAESCVVIVIAYDKRIYRTVGHDKLVAHNQLLDCAAAGDHMCLMAHALGLGACWLTSTDETAQRFKTRHGLPEYIQPVMHIAVGWAAMNIIKSGRAPLRDMIVGKKASG
jgi:nitroreductase